MIHSKTNNLDKVLLPGSLQTWIASPRLPSESTGNVVILLSQQLTAIKCFLNKLRAYLLESKESFLIKYLFDVFLYQNFLVIALYVKKRGKRDHEIRKKIYKNITTTIDDREVNNTNKLNMSNFSNIFLKLRQICHYSFLSVDHSI